MISLLFYRLRPPLRIFQSISMTSQEVFAYRKMCSVEAAALENDRHI